MEVLNMPKPSLYQYLIIENMNGTKKVYLK